MLTLVERYFDVAVDAGDGSIELVFYMLLIVLIIAIALRLLINRSS